MNKNKNSRAYETEYSSSFKWDHESRTHSNNPNGSQLRTGNSERSLSDRKVHQFRHKLKQALLEKLDQLESEYGMNAERKDPRAHYRPSDTRGPPNKAVDKAARKHRRSQQKRQWPPPGDDAIHSELRRSRSLAIEFKHKNEGTQIWWLADAGAGQERSHGDRDRWQHHRAAATTLTANGQPPSTTARTTQRWHRNAPSTSQPAGHKPLTSDNNHSQQSTFSRSSRSSHQIAQATGYQSTMDELSSFNHDNDGKSADQNSAKKWISNSDSAQHSSKKSTEIDIPKLDLPAASSDKDWSDHRAPLVFYPPYQKDDLILDTASSESNLNNVNNFETYRLD